MKFPAHIILDISKTNLTHSHQYWIFKYIFFLKKNKTPYISNLFLHKKFLLKKEELFFNKLIINQKKFTLKYSFSNPANFLTDKEKKFFTKVYTPRLKVKHRVLESMSSGKDIYDFLTNYKKTYNEKILKRLIKNFNFNTSYLVSKSNSLWLLFDIHFLRKEKIYTKLKYSRTPQYDIVSGGSAALLAGFLGFLITEKFGFELVDSGDFYFLFMYLVFLFFFSRIFLKFTDFKESSWNPFTLKWLFSFYKLIILLLMRSLNFFFNIFK